MLKRWTLIFLAGLNAWSQASDSLNKIISALHAKDYVEARSLSEAELKQSPNDARLWTLNGFALNHLGNGVQALAAYNRALQIMPDYLPALEGAAEIEYKNGSQRAVPLLERILKIHPEDNTSHAMLAELAFKRGDCKTAVQEFGQANAVIQTQTVALRQYGSCLVKLGRPGDAIPVFSRIVDLAPGARQAVYNLALVQSLAGRYGDVIRTLAPLGEAGSDPDTLDLLAEAYEANSDTPRAVQTLRRAIVANPDQAQLYVHFADLCLVHASYQVGIDMVNAGLNRLPRSAQLYLARGVLYVQLGQYEKGESDFSKAEELDPKTPVGATAQSITALQENDLGKAEETIRNRLKRQPGDAYLQYLLAETLARKGAVPGSAGFTEAIHAASRAVKLQPDFALARDVLARLYLAEGNAKEAVEQSRLAVQAEPSDQTALYHLIIALRQSNQKAEIPQLMKRLQGLREQARSKEAAEHKYAIVEANAGNRPANK